MKLLWSVNEVHTHTQLKFSSGHPDMKACHSPSKCDESEPCQAAVEIFCACGRISKTFLCGSCSSHPQSEANTRAFCFNHDLAWITELVIGLPCIDQCRIAQRNDRLADAFGLKKADVATQWTPAQIAYAQQNLRFVEGLEATMLRYDILR